MLDTTLLSDLGILVVAAAVGLVAAGRARLPVLLGYLVAGLVVGPGLGLVGIGDTLHLLSELGVALLLFTVGLEMSLARVREVGRTASVLGLLQVTSVTGLTFAFATAMGAPRVEALLLGLGVALSSTVVVIKTLDEARKLDSRHGRVSVGLLLVQDLIVVLALSILAGIGDGSSPGAGDTPLLQLARTVGGMLGLVAFAAIAARWVLPRAFAWAARGTDTLFLWSLGWCFLFIFAAEHLHLSVELGAFIAGMALGQLPWHQEQRRRVHPLTNFLLALFFTALGAGLEPGTALDRPGLLVGLLLLAVPGKMLIVIALLRWLGARAEVSLRTAITVSQISEFSFVLLALGQRTGLVGGDAVAVLGLAGLASLCVSALLIAAEDRLVELAGRTGLLRHFGREPRGPVEDDAKSESGHVIVVGMNPLGRHIARRFQDQGVPVTAIDTDPLKFGGMTVRTVLGRADDEEVLAEAGLDRAALLVTALQIEEVNDLLVFLGRRAGVPVAAHAFNPETAEELSDLGADHLMESRHEGARVVARMMAERGLLPAGQVS